MPRKFRDARRVNLDEEAADLQHQQAHQAAAESLIRRTRCSSRSSRSGGRDADQYTQFYQRSSQSMGETQRSLLETQQRLSTGKQRLGPGMIRGAGGKPAPDRSPCAP